MKPLPLPLRIAAGLVATAVDQARDLPRLVVEFPVTAVSQALQVTMRVQQKVTELAIKGDRVLGTLSPVEERPSWATFDDEATPRRNGASTVTELRPPSGRTPVAQPPAPQPQAPRSEPGSGARRSAAPEVVAPRPPDARSMARRAAAREAAEPAAGRSTAVEPITAGTGPAGTRAATREPDAPAQPDPVPATDDETADGPTGSVAAPDEVVWTSESGDAGSAPTTAATAAGARAAGTAPKPGPQAVPAAAPAPVDAPVLGSEPGVLPGYANMSIPQLRGKLRFLSLGDLRTLLEWENAHGDRPAFVTMLSNRITTVQEG